MQRETDRLTILEMLDTLDASLAAMHARDGQGERPRPVLFDMSPDAVPAALLVEMQRAGLSKAEFCSIFGVHVNVLQAWLTGDHPPPSWVPVCVRILALLAPPARQGLLKSAEPRKGKNPARSHPFSRIEEL